MATYQTQIQWGGPDGDWHDDTDLMIEFHNRTDIVPADGHGRDGDDPLLVRPTWQR